MATNLVQLQLGSGRQLARKGKLMCGHSPALTEQFCHRYWGTGESCVFSYWPEGVFRVGQWTMVSLSSVYAVCDITGVCGGFQVNSFFQALDSDGFMIGGGGDGAHLSVDSAMFRGTSAQSDTYNTGPLAPPEFNLTKVECWGFTSNRSKGYTPEGKMDYNFLFSNHAGNVANEVQ